MSLRSSVHVSAALRRSVHKRPQVNGYLGHRFVSSFPRQGSFVPFFNRASKPSFRSFWRRYLWVLPVAGGLTLYYLPRQSPVLNSLITSSKVIPVPPPRPEPEPEPEAEADETSLYDRGSVRSSFYSAHSLLTGSDLTQRQRLSHSSSDDGALGFGIGMTMLQVRYRSRFLRDFRVANSHPRFLQANVLIIG